ncbi:MAG: hypothetical protein IPM29_18425 [Planctomycetes bacterium]|nr:hypothetical protein [Planctomycetota bacterium]
MSANSITVEHGGRAGTVARAARMAGSPAAISPTSSGDANHDLRRFRGDTGEMVADGYRLTNVLIGEQGRVTLDGQLVAIVWLVDTDAGRKVTVLGDPTGRYLLDQVRGIARDPGTGT